MRAFSLFFLLAIGSAAHARIFDFNETSLAAYMRGIGGLSAVGQEPFGNSSGEDTSIDGETNFNYGGELGFQFGFSKELVLRLGAEIIQHRPVREAKGLNASGQERFTLDSNVFVFNPNLTFEYAYRTTAKTKFYMAAGMGLADITIENRYKMTATGTSELGGVTDYNEKIQGTSTSFHFLTGLETTFVDNATFSIDAGYRYLRTKELKYKAPANSIVSPGGVEEGDIVRNHDGTDRQMDLGGLYMGMTLKFYLNFL